MIDKKETRMESEINKNKNEEDSFLVTNVKINLFPNSKNKLKGKASITLSDCFVVHGIKILIGEKGFFIAMPSTKNSKGVYVDVAHPINTETRQMIESSITKVFQEMINKESQSYVSDSNDSNDSNDESDTNDDESSEFEFKTNDDILEEKK
ncbi:SpoVG family protein ['Camptotheca acuminata' phytoplasma]|uniref:SpoVG family protein n=1 Tax='Camptotheca acuminata' phytoplasma TaxID=3239192 RepID=UPI00351A890C